MFLVVAILLLLFAPNPWNLIGFLVALVAFVGELLFWNRRVRGRAVETGPDLLIGRTAIVVRECRPTGQVRTNDPSEVWQARCEEGAGEGETVRIVGRDGLVLRVERTAPPT
jgi:membrane protein implicated in regulation of membrane protease activity